MDNKAESVNEDTVQEFRTPPSREWTRLTENWLRDGYVGVPNFLSNSACTTLIACYSDDRQFRSRITMARHHFGRGEYSYFNYPLPKIIHSLRQRLYAALVPWANRLMIDFKRDLRYPPRHRDFIAHCHQCGQNKPTPLVLRYQTGDYNRLHQDIYGETLFPIQGTILLNSSSAFAGGEFVLVENRPRQQSIPTVLRPNQGDLILFPVADRPVMGARRMLRARIRHGVSQITAGERWTLGILFHDGS